MEMYMQITIDKYINSWRYRKLVVYGTVLTVQLPLCFINLWRLALRCIERETVAVLRSMAPRANIRPAAPPCPRSQPSVELPSVHMTELRPKMNLVHFKCHRTPLVRVQKNPGFFKKAQPGWVLLGFIGFGVLLVFFGQAVPDAVK